MTGTTIAHYRCLEQLGQGGMGVVYKARDLSLGRLLALKVLAADKVADPERKRRFVQEAKSASALNHPNIVAVYEIGCDAGVDFIAMEYVEGRTLDEVIGHKGLPLNEALNYAVQIADGLAVAHAAGMVHRDIKPRNIIINPRGLVKILDFGLAKLTEPGEIGEFADTQSLQAGAPAHTEEGAIVGTLAYMSPEQAEGKKVDPRKRPVGAPFAYHLHPARRSLMSAEEIRKIGLSVAGSSVIFSMAETTGNIWLTTMR